MSDDTVIRVENLGKHYRLGLVHHDRLADAITAGLDRARAGLRRLWQGARSEEREEPPGRQPEVRGPQSPDFIWALKDVSFTVKRGEVLGVIGKNGAGKSTLLKILSRITEPTEGRVTLRGRVASLLEVGTGFHPELTGRENVFLNGAILGMSKAEIRAKLDEIVAFAEVEKFVHTPVKRYSSGMYVRLAFAVAAHLEPEILLVDEVLAVGDVAFQKKCLGKMADVAQEGRTVLFVSHNMGAIRKLCHRTIMFQAGKKELDDATDLVVGRYVAIGSSEISSSVALPEGPPGAPGRATHLRFAASDGTPRAHFRLREQWRITLEFEMLKPTQHVIAGIGVSTLDSIGLITYWSTPQDLEPGRYRVEFVCDTPLAATDLQFQVGLSQHETNFYYHQGIGHVSISEAAQGDQPIRASGVGLLVSQNRPQIQTV